jgi:hypothetical protein
MTTGSSTNCAHCGMLVEPVDAYHPYAACLMFMASKNGRSVRMNLQEVRDHATKPLHAEIEQLRAALTASESDAAKWRALTGCERIRVLGWVGIEDPASEMAHVGFEIWTSYKHPDVVAEKERGVKVLTDFADKAAALSKRSK